MKIKITLEEVNGCPTLTAKKGNVSIISEGMNFLLTKAFIEHDNGVVEEVTDYERVEELDRDIFTKEEKKLICRVAQSY